MFFCPFSFGHCVVCSSSIYGLWLPLWYPQTCLPPWSHALYNVILCMLYNLLEFPDNITERIKKIKLQLKKFITISVLMKSWRVSVIDKRKTNFHLPHITHKCHHVMLYRFFCNNDVKFPKNHLNIDRQIDKEDLLRSKKDNVIWQIYLLYLAVKDYLPVIWYCMSGWKTARTCVFIYFTRKFIYSNYCFLLVTRINLVLGKNCVFTHVYVICIFNWIFLFVIYLVMKIYGFPKAYYILHLSQIFYSKVYALSTIITLFLKPVFLPFYIELRNVWRYKRGNRKL